MWLTLDRPDNDGALRVRCGGQISQARFPGPTDPLLDLLGPDGHALSVRLDLGEVDHVDSSGVGWLVGVHRRFQEAGGRLVLSRVPPVIDQILRFSGLDHLLHVERQPA